LPVLSFREPPGPQANFSLRTVVSAALTSSFTGKPETIGQQIPNLKPKSNALLGGTSGLPEKSPS